MQLRYFAALHDIAGERWPQPWSSRCRWTCWAISPSGAAMRNNLRRRGALLVRRESLAP